MLSGSRSPSSGSKSFRGMLAGVANTIAKSLGARDSPSSFSSFRSAGSFHVARLAIHWRTPSYSAA